MPRKFQHPKPKPEETRPDFIIRCCVAPVMVVLLENRRERADVCGAIWKRHHGKLTNLYVVMAERLRALREKEKKRRDAQTRKR